MPRARAIRLLRTLVGFDTTSRNPNRPLIDFIAEYLTDLGIGAQILPAAEPGKAGLIASIGPADRRGGILLSGHTDTVPVDGQRWRSDPFVLRQEDDRLYGRGSCDMKGFIAAVLALAGDWVQAPLRRPLHLVLSHDEEVGCLAAPQLVAAALARVPSPALAIIGEPSGMRIASSHRGITTFATTVIGRAAHSGLPEQGANAIVAAAACIAYLERLAGELERTGTGEPPGEWPAAATTLNVGTIAGGTAVNTVAPFCRFDWECRPAPGFDAETVSRALARFAAAEVLPRLHARAPEARIETEVGIAVPPLAADATAAALACALAEDPEPTTVPFASEAGFFQRAGVPAVVCGPGFASEAHQADEFLSVPQLDACVAFLQRMAGWLCRALPGSDGPVASPASLP